MRRCVALLLGAAIACSVRAGPAGKILEDSGVKGGIVVAVGQCDAAFLTEFGANGACVVQGLDTDAAMVATVRQQILAKGLHGRVSVNTFDGRRLPYAENLVNLVVAGVGCQVSREELTRVLVPGGTAVFLNGGQVPRGTVRKPWPSELDEWTHFLHSASGNPVSEDAETGPPGGLRWHAGPLWGRSHEFNNSTVAMVTARGRLFYVFDYGVTGMEDPRLPEQWTLEARDAFNGSPLWQRPLPTWGTKAWKTKALRLFGGMLARRLTADGDRLYCTVDYSGDVEVLDAATGKTLSTIPGTAGTMEVLAAGGQVLCVGRAPSGEKGPPARIVCYDAAAGKIMWEARDGSIAGQLTCVGGDAVVYHNRKETVCLNRADGTVRWNYAPAVSELPKPPQGKKPGRKKRRGNPGQPTMLFLAGDKAILASRKAITGLSLENGKPLWTTSQGPQGNTMREYDVFCARGQVWCSGPGSITGYDFGTGEKTESIDVSAVQSQGHHLRCYRAKSTQRHLITQYRGIEFLSMAGEPHNQNDWVRGSCTYGVMPANGLLYQPPHSCFCYAGAMMKGFNAYSARPAPGAADPLADAQPGPVEKGQAFSIPMTGDSSPASSSWPTYRGDVRRAGAVSGGLPGSPKLDWKAELGGAITPPVASDGRVYVAARDRYLIHALDAKSGDRLWTFAAGARIDSPPSVHRGRVVFGCGDGYLYCVAAKDGRLVWRRRLAPAERWIAVDGRLESAWRLHGSVAILGDLAYCSAGRSTFLDGGLFLYAVDIGTGEIKHSTRLHTLTDTREDNARNEFVAAYHIEGGNSDVIVAEGGYIYINQMRFSPDLKRQPAKYLSKAEVTKQPPLNLDNKPYVNEDIFNVSWAGRKFDTFEKMADIIVDENKNLGERDLGLHLFTTSGFLDDTFFNRTYWTYRRTWVGFNHSIFAPKSGQLVVVGPETTYALKAYTSRYPLSARYDPQTKGYLLIADANDHEPTIHPTAWAKDKGMGFSRVDPPVWHRWLPVRVKAMVLAGDALYVCGPPDKVRDGDPLAAFDGRMGSELWTLKADSGEVVTKTSLADVPSFDAMIAAEGRLLMTTESGSVVCFAGR